MKMIGSTTADPAAASYEYSLTTEVVVSRKGSAKVGCGAAAFVLGLTAAELGTIRGAFDVGLAQPAVVSTTAARTIVDSFEVMRASLRAGRVSK
jgi:hypothetical protein